MSKPLARKILSEVSPYTPGKPIEEVQRELGIPKAMKLASNENALGPSPKALEAVRSALGNLHRYPDGQCFYLVRKIAQAMNVAPEEVIVGNGSDEVITFAVRAFVEPGDEVVIADPTFLVYKIASQLAQAKIKVVPSIDFRYDLAAMKKAVTPKTKIVFIANPDNPTGTYVTRPEVEAFLDGLPEEVIVFMDEAYAETADVPDYPDSRAYFRKRPLIIARTFSKAYGLSGIRVGYGIAQAELVAAMHKVREPFNVNSLAQAAAIGALDDAEHLEKTKKLLREQKPVIYKALEELGLQSVPSATNFILFRVGPQAPQVVQSLLKRGIIVRDMRAWNLPEYIRVTVGLPEENRAFVDALKEALTREEKKS